MLCGTNRLCISLLEITWAVKQPGTLNPEEVSLDLSVSNAICLCKTKFRNFEGLVGFNKIDFLFNNDASRPSVVPK